MRFASLLSGSIGLIGCFAGPALADAVVYTGTVGDKAVVLELTAPPENGDPVAGRFATMAEGIDIGLDDVSTGKGTLTLAERAPCGVNGDLCTMAEDGSMTRPPAPAEWTLKAAGDTLTGTWTAKTSNRSLPIALKRHASRPIDLSEGALADALNSGSMQAETDAAGIVDPERFPYEFAKLDVPTTKGPATSAEGAVARLDPDERLDLAFPVVETLGGPDTGPVNAYLRGQRFLFDLLILDCGLENYHGIAFSPADAKDLKDLAADINAELERVSPELIAYREAGSLFCGGAHPDNFIDHHLVDTRTGVPVLAESLLAGWSFTDANGAPVDPATYDNSDYSMVAAPSAELIATVKKRRATFDAEREAECPYDELIDNSLGVYFTQDALVFTLQGLSHAEFACGDDLLTVPLAEAKPLLTADALRYFPALAN